MSNYFTLLHVDESFEVNLNELEAHYLKMQQAYHPDRFIDKSAPEKTLATRKTVEINDAYRCLKDDLKRAEYLLSMQGVLINEGESTIKPSQALLMESMEQREALAEANTLDDITKLEKATNVAIVSQVENLKLWFKDHTWDKAGEGTIRLKYLQKLKEEIRQKKGQLG